MMKKIIIFSYTFLILIGLFSPIVKVYAETFQECMTRMQNSNIPTDTARNFCNLSETSSSNTGLVPCNNTPDSKGVIAQPCDFNAFLALIDKVIKFILFDMAIPIAAIMFVYAGFLLVTAGGEAAGARTKAKTIFTNAIIGLALAAAAWLIIRTILSILGYDGTWIGF
ncbi:hypothetical protein A3C60_00675 [Candidatus Nomurabacteria bacterium RIFCSPHIGHO2_02_FULL_37_45]|uniref:Uncharacterized protein n=2 Tax=Candidatus Nomuraibacteriota TaxID=1752729 RepID=A0A1F6Y752_9BACT|nr:MAG: hypothetical protein A3C60_00675 [Candidatus Nomurabacteria bacterium RIFCSPHIGHO2_02_FULL_37_45]OGI78681.1 MAG: hypothetical protein A3F19_01830 [Candidatus Nomurabacteria bacterium RIFCSPHIGHO2_12_FULL_37_29]OGJ02204.1 MAG: hypothetical protein A3G98_02120 [Candidatus Nomurabacteria bacterium RIFCSPLOWO2_12_FULL_37_8]